MSTEFDAARLAHDFYALTIREPSPEDRDDARRAFQQLIEQGAITVRPQTVTIGVQVNGKTQGTVVVPHDAPVDVAMRIARSMPFFARFADLPVTGVDYKPGQILRITVGAEGGT